MTNQSISQTIKDGQDKDAMLKRALDRLRDLYTDTTHFVYELLQNAEDAGASKVKFIEKNNYLEVIHNGLPFTQSNAEALCNAAFSDKVFANSTQIGQFGVGFLSVFAICRTVKLYCDPKTRPIPDALPRFAFEIMDYTRPEDLTENWSLDDGYTTRFIFPYDHTVRYKDISNLRKDIARRLRVLGAESMLFLKNIVEISYEIRGVDGIDDVQGDYLLERQHINELCTKVSTIGDKDNSNEEAVYLMYTKSIPGKRRSVDFVFKIDDSGKNPTFLDSSKEYPYISVYFPTEMESKLKFIIQAPFSTTPNRGGVLPSDENKSIVTVAADLLREVVEDVKQCGWLTLEFLNLLPFNRDKYTDLLGELYRTTTSILKDKDVFPTLSGKYVTQSNGYIADAKWLAELFNDELLGSLVGNPNAMWLPTDLTKDNKALSDIFSYLHENNRAREIRAEHIPARLRNVRFLEDMDENWLTHFYNTLVRNVPSLLSKQGDFSTVPFIKTTTGEFIAAYTLEGRSKKQNCYRLPSHSNTVDGFHFVADFIADKCPDFVEAMDIVIPYGYDYFIKEIKSCKDKLIDEEQNIKQVKNAVKYLVNTDERPGICDDLVYDELKRLLQLRCVKPNGNIIYTVCSSGNLYFPNDINGVSLLDYFSDIDANVCVLDQKYYEQSGIHELKILAKIGVNDSVYDWGSKYWKLGNAECECLGAFWRYLNFRYIDCAIKYLNSYSDQWGAKVKSAAIFSLANNVKNSLKGEWKRGKTILDIHKDEAAILETLKSREWIYAKDGKLCSPKGMQRDYINLNIYGNIDKTSDIFDILGFSPSLIGQRNDLSAQLSRLPSEQIIEVVNKLHSEQQEAIFNALLEEGFDLKEEFDPTTVGLVKEFPTDTFSNLEELRKRAVADYKNAIDVKYEPILRRIRTSRGNADKERLRYKYRGCCQMCYPKQTSSRDWEIVEIFEKPTKEVEFMNLSLCPTCAARYRRYRRDSEIVSKIKEEICKANLENLVNANTTPAIQVTADEKISFTAKHLAAIHAVMPIIMNSQSEV